jgi:hypothetical protein
LPFFHHFDFFNLNILHRCFLPSLTPFGPAISEEKIFLTLANQKQELPLAAIFVGGMGRNEETKNRTYGKIARFW